MPSLVSPVVPAGRMARQAQPVLSAHTLVLRPWQAADVPTLVAAYSDADIQRWNGQSMSQAEAAAYVSAANAGWAAETAANWAVTEDGAVVGRMAVRSVNLVEGLGVIAYWVLPAGRGRGVAGRALTAVSAWALDELGLHRLELEHSTANAASCRVATKAGYALESTKRRQARHVDGWHDVHSHVLLDDDPRAAPSAVDR